MYKTLTIWSKNDNGIPWIEPVDGYFVYATNKNGKTSRTQLERTGFWICLRISREAIETGRKGSRTMLFPFTQEHTTYDTS